MNLLLHSNGVHKVKKEKLSMIKICKRVLLFFLALLILGFIVQISTDFIDNERIKSRFKYVRIEGKKMEYKIKGSGAYTVVFDGSIGANMYEWDNVCKDLEENRDITIFTYNRRGYGFNDGGELRTPENQAKDLKSLLKKVGATPPYIFVGEEYGSLVTTNFVKLYPDLVEGVVFIDPILEDNLNTKEFKKSIKSKYYRSNIEYIGSNFSLTSLLSKMGLTIENDTFKQHIRENELEEFKILENKKNYKQAVANEITNLYKNNSDSQIKGLLLNKPLYIITDNEDNPIKELGDSNFTTIHKHEIKDSPISVLDPDSVVNGINSVVKDVKKLEKHS